MLTHLDMENAINSHSEVGSEEDEEVSSILGKFVKNSKKQKVGRKPVVHNLNGRFGGYYSRK